MKTLLPIQVGSLVTAKRTSGVCDPGERGVCFEVYELAGRPGWSFIFESGRYDGFSPEDVAIFLEVTGAVCQAVATYQFRNVGQLCRDFQDGRFDPGFHVEPHAERDPDRYQEIPLIVTQPSLWFYELGDAQQEGVLERCWMRREEAARRHRRCRQEHRPRGWIVVPDDEAAWGASLSTDQAP